MFVSMSLGAYLKHTLIVGIVSFGAGIGAALLYAKLNKKSVEEGLQQQVIGKQSVLAQIKEEEK